MNASDIFIKLACAAIGAAVVLGIVRLVNQREKIDLRFWLASAAVWIVWLGNFWAWVAWRADAPGRKDGSFSLLVAPVWLFASVFIVATEFYRFRSQPMGKGARITWTIVSSIFQIATLLIIAVLTGIYVHFAAGGKE